MRDVVGLLSPSQLEGLVNAFFDTYTSAELLNQVRDLSGRLKLTVRRHKFNNDSLSTRCCNREEAACCWV